VSIVCRSSTLAGTSGADDAVALPLHGVSTRRSENRVARFRRPIHHDAGGLLAARFDDANAFALNRTACAIGSKEMRKLKA